MLELLKLGDYYVSNFVTLSESENPVSSSLDLVLDPRLNIPRLRSAVSYKHLWGKYWYKSSINNSMKGILRDIVEEICSRVEYKHDDIWLDIASNDGTLLSFVPSDFKKLGIDPVEGEPYSNALIQSEIIQDYFSKTAWSKSSVGNKKANIITVISMFYDLTNPGNFLKDVYEVLDHNGLLIIQMSYTPIMIRQLAFDNICHEHFYYYDLSSLSELLNLYGFTVIDCILNNTNGGSFRVYARKSTSDLNFFKSELINEVSETRVRSILEYEKNVIDIRNVETWIKFANDIQQLKVKLLKYLLNEKKLGKKIFGYGASTKGNTFLQYLELDDNLIEAIADKDSSKHGLYTVGTMIPIISEEEMRLSKPDVLLVLPWHFIDGFLEREKKFLINGGKIVVAIPEFRIYESRV